MLKYDVTEQEMEGVTQHMYEMELMAMDTWVTQKFQPDNPITNQFLKKYAPAYYQRRLEQLKKVREYQDKITGIRMFGPQNGDDLAFQYWYDKVAPDYTAPGVQSRGPHEKFESADQDPPPGNLGNSNFGSGTDTFNHQVHPMRQNTTSRFL